VTKLDVSRLQGVFSLVGKRGEIRPIRLGGQPVREFLPGWLPRGACDSFAPWTVLDLLHASGREASWLLDGNLEHASKPLDQLNDLEQALLKEQAAPAIRAVHQALLCAARPRSPPELGLFDGLNQAFVAEIVALAASHAIGETRVVDLHRQVPDLAGIRINSAKGRSRTIRLGAVPACLGGNFQDALQAALADGTLSCPSPVDRRPMRSRDSLVLHEHRIAYRFVDDRYDLVFFVSTTDYFFAKADLFIPCINTAFTAHGDDKHLETLAQDFLAHVIHDAALLLAYLGAGPAPTLAPPSPESLVSELPERRFAVVCRGYPHLHMGHQLWNELTALDRLLRDIPPAQLPTVIVPNAAQGSEVFAPIDRIFPEYAGRVDRSLRSPETLGQFVYRQGYCLFRAIDEHVTLDLARRIRDASAEDRPPDDDERLAARIRTENIPCVLFGLRVENRTAIDPLAVVADSIEHLRQRLGRVVVVLDGHNARLHHDPVSQYDSFGQEGHEPPVFAELHLALQVRRRFENTGVEIVNLCGSTMARSLFWSERADFFVAFWGAGLSKYRWVCNRPGLVLSNQWNLSQRGDIDIYHAPRYQEGGSAIRFIDAASIADLPQAPVLFAPVANPAPFYSNFHVDPEGLRRELDAMIAEHLTSMTAEHSR